MARTSYSEEQKKEFVRQWLASGKSKPSWFKEMLEAGQIEGHPNSLHNWATKYADQVQGETPRGFSAVNPNSPKAIKEQIERLQQQYKESLSNRVRELEENLVSIQEELEQAKKELADSQQEEEM